jgi:hypothetical protein
VRRAIAARAPALRLPLILSSALTGRLYSIVGKGNHSVDHIQKLKPAVEKLCREHGLEYATEENAGRIYVDLKGNRVDAMPPPPSGYPGSSHRPPAGHGRPPRQQMEYEDREKEDGLLASCLKGCTIL